LGCQGGDVLCAAPGQADSGAAVAVVVDDGGAWFVFEADALGAERAQAHAEGLGWVGGWVGQGGEELLVAVK
jgi:hypothetical protein